MLLFVIFVPQKSSEVVIFQEVVLDLFGGESFGFLEYFTGKPIVSGKPFPCPTPSGLTNRWTIESMRLAFALRRAFPVGVLAAGSLWQGVLGLVALSLIQSMHCVLP